jgi:hypothetical protein
MKKLALPILSIAFLSLTGCGTSSPSAMMSTAADIDIDLTFDAKKYEVEMGEYLAITVQITCDDTSATKKVSFTLSENDGIAALVGESVNSEGKVYIAGKKSGIVTLTATCVDNPNVSASAQVEVIARIPSLKNVWQNVNEYTNYTLLTKQTLKSDATSTTNYVRTLVTDDAILGEYYYTDQITGDKTTGPYLVDQDNNYVNGYAIDKNNYAFLLRLDRHGNFLTDSEIVDTEHGLLTRDNYRGFKEKSVDINDVGLYYGLQAINPSWLPTAKAKGTANTYTIDNGDEENYKSAYVKYLLWGLIDPIGRNVFMNANESISSVVELASKVDLSIQATTASMVKMTLSYTDGVSLQGDLQKYIYTTTINNIGSTVLPQAEKIKKFTSSFEASRPGLPTDIGLLMSETKKHNYICSYKLFWADKVNPMKEYSSEVNVYYTEDYLFLHYPDEFVSLYNSTTGSTLSTFGYGYIKKSDGIYGFEYDPTNSQPIQLYDEPYKGTKDTPLYKCTFEEIPDYFDYSEIVYYDHLYALSKEAYDLNTEITDYHFSGTNEVFHSFCDWFYKEKIENESLDFEGFLTGLRINTTGSDENIALDSVDFFAAYSTINGWSVLATPTLSKFGQATSNVAHSAILSILES